MGLRDIDLRKRQPLSLQLPTIPQEASRYAGKKQEDKEPLSALIPAYSLEELQLSAMIALNPHVKTLIEGLDLVSYTTGRKLKIASPEALAVLKNVPQLDQPSPQNPATTQEEKLSAIVNAAITDGRTYTRAEAVAIIMEATGVDEKRAERGFSMIAAAGLIEENGEDTYYLTGGVPF